MLFGIGGIFLNISLNNNLNNNTIDNNSSNNNVIENEEELNNENSNTIINNDKYKSCFNDLSEKYIVCTENTGEPLKNKAI